MERAIQLFAAVNFLVIGISHIVQPRAWVSFFVRLRGLGHAGVFANGMLSLLFGSIIVGFHNVWSGLPLILTLVGWAQVAKGLISLTAPSVSLRSLMRVSDERAREFVAGGVVALILGGLQVYILLRA